LDAKIRHYKENQYFEVFFFVFFSLITRTYLKLRIYNVLILWTRAED